MRDIRPPSWLEWKTCSRLRPPGVTSVNGIDADAETQRREYPEFIIQLSPHSPGD